jgi:hypothetical protein
MVTRKIPILRRYTDLPALIHLLRSKQVTLLSPTTWDDRNDRHYMEVFKQRRKLKTLLALCFSEAGETYHHWKVFASGSSGVCIEFDKFALLEYLPKIDFTHSKIDYRTIAGLSASNLLVKDLPFTKRHAFGDECEYRIVYSSKTVDVATQTFPLPISAIRRVILNPWVPDPLYGAVWESLKSIDNCGGLSITKSRLIESEQWKGLAGQYS